MFAQVNEAVPPLRKARPDAPEILEQVVARATAKRPEDRYATARELGDALRAALAALPAEAKTRASAPRSLTEFALPEIAAKGSTTAPATLVKGAADPGKGHGPALIVAGALSVGLLTGIIYLAAKPHGGEDHHGPASSAASSEHAAGTAEAVAAATVAAAAEPPPKNPWVRVEPPQRSGRGEPVRLGVADSAAPSVKGFRPKRAVTAPADAFEIQQHEVTWEEIDPWLAATPAAAFERPGSVPAEPGKRARLPVTGVPWETARAYCKSLGGATLPSEEQWEFAARGEALRPYAWGPQPVDLLRTHAFAGPSASAVEVMSSDQDVTPGDQAHAVYDLMGNAREWTADLYRGDQPGDDSWAQEGGITYRAVRGLPLAAAARNLPAEGAAYREALCATGPCPADTKSALQWVGFRCARPARAHEGRP
jgi:formylglycine-generating enzyme required for sulfatase activity